MNNNKLENNTYAYSGKGISERIFAVIGDNGMAVVTNEFSAVEAMRTLKRVSMFEFNNINIAQQYAIGGYVNRFFMRHYKDGKQPIIPQSLPINEIYTNDNFDDGNCGNLTMFPGLLV